MSTGTCKECKAVTILHSGYCAPCLACCMPLKQTTPTQRIPTPEQLLDDPCTPYWTRGLIRDCLQRDAVDTANVLDLIAKSFQQRADRILKGGR